MENRTDALIAELDAFMADYDRRTSALSPWRELVADDATYWFTDGSFTGIDSIADAVQRTFDEIQDETYTISDLHWVCASPDCWRREVSLPWVGYETARGARAGVEARTR